MKVKVLFSFFVLCFVLLATVAYADETWQGNAAIALRGELDRDGYYAASNSFPPGTKILVTNLDNNRRIIVTVRQRLDGTSNVFLLVSNSAGNELGMKPTDVIRIKTQVVGISTDLTGGMDLAANRDMETNPAIGTPDLGKTNALVEASPQPSPSLIPTPSPSPSLVPTPSPSPTPSPQETIQPSPTPTPTPEIGPVKTGPQPEKDRFALPNAGEAGALSARTMAPAPAKDNAGDVELKEARVALKERGEAVILSRPENEAAGTPEEVVAILVEPKAVKKPDSSAGLTGLDRPTPDRETVEAALNDPNLAEKDKPFIYERHGATPAGEELALATHDLPENAQGEKPDVETYAPNPRETDQLALDTHNLPEVGQTDKPNITALDKIAAEQDRVALETHSLPEVKDGEKPDVTALAMTEPEKDKPALQSQNLPALKEREQPDVLPREEVAGKDKKSVDLALVPTDPRPPKKTNQNTQVVTNVPDNTHPTRIEPDNTNPVWDNSAGFSKNYYYLQLGVFASREAAEKVGRAYPSYPMSIVSGKVNSADVYKVVVGPLKRDETGTALYLFKARGYRDAFLRFIE